MDDSDDSGLSEHVLELRHEDHSNHILVNLQSLYDDGILCDVTLHAAECSIKAHKIVLVANSDYFTAMFSGSWTEAQSKDVVLHGLTPTGLKAVIHFCYFGKLLVNFENITEIVAAIHHCQLVKSYELIEEYLSNELNVTNFFDLLKLAEDFSLLILHDNLVKFAIKQFMPSAMFPGGFLTCLHRLEATFLRMVIKEWDFVKSGLGYFAAVELLTKWSLFDLEGREQYLEDFFLVLEEKVGDVEIPNVGDVMHYVNLTSEERRTQTSEIDSDTAFVTFMYGDDPAIYVEETNSWKVIANFPGPELQYDSFGVTVLDNCLYVCGGFSDDPNQVVEDKCHRYDPMLDRWLPVSRLQNGRKMFPLVSLQNKLYALGGIAQNHNPVHSVEMYNPNENAWIDSTPLPLALASHAATVCGGKVYVSGGQSEYYGEVLGWLMCYDPGSTKWGFKKEMLSARCNHMLVAHNDKLYQVGGEKSDCVVRVCSVECYDIATNSWTELNIFQDDLNTYPYGVCVRNNIFYLWFEVMMRVPQRRDTLYVSHFDPDSKTLVDLYKQSSWMGVGAKHWCPLRFPKFVVKYMPKYLSVSK